MVVRKGNKRSEFDEDSKKNGTINAEICMRLEKNSGTKKQND